MVDFKFADIGEGIHEGQILKWFVKEGDQIKEGETLCVIETDKVNAEIPSPVDGVIKKLGAKVGETIHVGNTLALIDDGSATKAEEPKKQATVEEAKSGSGVVGEIEESNEVIAAEATPEVSQEQKRILATPIARHIANELGVDIATIKGSGENGRVLREDIENAVKETKTAKQPYVEKIDFSTTQNGIRHEKITKMRKTIAKNMTTSKSIIPHVTMFDEYNISDLVAFRQAHKQLALDKGIKLTYMAFIIKAVTKVLKEFPKFNASFDDEKEEMLYKEFINIGIAVDTPEGLMVPNIKNADQKGIFDIALEVEQLAQASNDRTIQLPQLQNGTFSITNYGAADALYGTPIIKYPEVAILGIGKITKKPIVINGEIAIADILPISLAFDHRVIDGADAGRFSARLKEYLSNPVLLLLG